MVTYVVFGILVVIICLLVFFCLTGETDRQTRKRQEQAAGVCGNWTGFGCATSSRVFMIFVRFQSLFSILYSIYIQYGWYIYICTTWCIYLFKATK